MMTHAPPPISSQQCKFHDIGAAAHAPQLDQMRRGTAGNIAAMSATAIIVENMIHAVRG